MNRDLNNTSQLNKTLLVDAGNTRLKWALWPDGDHDAQQAQIYAVDTSPQEAGLDVLKELFKQYRPQRVVLVHVLGSKFVEAVDDLCQQVDCILSPVSTTSTTCGIKIAYDNPAHFGADRLVALLAARDIAGERPAIIIDCGTAVTVDALEYDNQHLGGLILPGLSLLSDALIQRTQAKHMDSSVFDTPHVFTTDTAKAIGSGCLFSLVGAIEGICQRMQDKMSGNAVKIICGGDAGRVHTHLRGDYLLEPAALMRGLSMVAEQY